MSGARRRRRGRHARKAETGPRRDRRRVRAMGHPSHHPPSRVFSGRSRAMRRDGGRRKTCQGAPERLSKALRTALERTFSRPATPSRLTAPTSTRSASPTETTPPRRGGAHDQSSVEGRRKRNRPARTGRIQKPLHRMRIWHIMKRTRSNSRSTDNRRSDQFEIGERSAGLSTRFRTPCA